MKRIFYTLVFLLGTAGFVGVASAQSTSGPPPVSSATPAPTPKRWEKFSPPRAGFTLLLPGKITAQEQMVDKPGGKMLNRVYFADLEGDVFMVSYLEFPDPVTDSEAIKLMLDMGRDGVEGAGKATLKSESEIKHDGYSGRLWLLSLPNGIKATAKAFWVSNTLYQLLVITNEVQTPAEAKLTSERMSRFFDSFTLTSTASN